jgi:hypothetical protein
MKLATIKDGTRDGQLAVVSRDLKTAVLADGIAPTMQRALDDWRFIAVSSLIRSAAWRRYRVLTSGPMGRLM